MSKRGIISVIVAAALFAGDFIADKVYESGKVLFDNQMALLQMKNSDMSYLSYSIYAHSDLYYGIMFLINLVIISILLIININNFRGMKK
jgi:hypothetical protein